MIEKKDLDINSQDIINLAENKNTNLTEAEVMANIIRDPILIGVTR